MNKYAKNTSVSVSKSKDEIERMILRFGAKKFITGIDGNRAFVCFVYEDRAIKREIELPPQSDYEMTPARKKKRAREDMIRCWEQACQQKWRALALSIKGKLVSINEGIATFEDEFLAYTFLAGFCFCCTIAFCTSSAEAMLVSIPMPNNPNARPTALVSQFSI